MTEWTRGLRRCLTLSAGVAALVLGGGSSAAALTYLPEPVSYETEPAIPPFCAPTVVQDYLLPLKRLPKLRSPSAAGRVGFGPASLRLTPLPALVAGEGRVGYKLFLERGARTAHPDWTVKTTLTRIDWKGRALKVIDERQRRVRTLRAGRGAGVQFEIKGFAAPYRVTTVFRSETGKKLGKYGFYFRLVRPSSSVGLSLNAGSYRAGSTVFGRIENLGTTPVSYGAAFAIERLEKGAWKRWPESPEAFTLQAFTVAPGMSEGCSSFRVRPWTPPGRYRMAKEVNIQAPPQSAVTPTVLYAEFDVVP